MNDKIKLKNIYNHVKETLADAGITDIAEADFLLCEALKINRSGLMSKLLAGDNGNGVLTKQQGQAVNKLLRERAKGRPLDKIVKHKNFYGQEFYVNKNVLSPRKETELLAECVIDFINKNFVSATTPPASQAPLHGGEFIGNLAEASDEAKISSSNSRGVTPASKLIRGPAALPVGRRARVLDLCTGSGCVAITIAKNCKCEVTACDVSKKALAVARKNIKYKISDINGGSCLIKNSPLVKLILSDMFKSLNPKDRFDIIVCNPPYIKSGNIEHLDKEVKDYDPRLSLDGGADGLKFYKIIAGEAHKFLNPNGVLMLEIGFDQAEAVTKLLKNKYKNIEVIKDYGGQDRIVKVKTKK